MTTIFHVINDGDCYEIRLHGHVIADIVRYLNGSNLRQEMLYSAVPEAVKDEILEQVHKIILNEDA